MTNGITIGGVQYELILTTDNDCCKCDLQRKCSQLQTETTLCGFIFGDGSNDCLFKKNTY